MGFFIFDRLPLELIMVKSDMCRKSEFPRLKIDINCSLRLPYECVCVCVYVCFVLELLKAIFVGKFHNFNNLG